MCVFGRGVGILMYAYELLLFFCGPVARTTLLNRYLDVAFETLEARIKNLPPYEPIPTKPWYYFGH